MSKGQTKKTREAAGNRRKLTRAEKKQIAAVIRQAKGDGKAHTAQQTIPYLAMYPDGICKVAQRKYSKSIAFEDINYQLAQADDKTAIFENCCDFLNYFDASVNVQLSFINQGSQQEQAALAIHIPLQNDDFNSIRTEYSDMLKSQLAKGNNGLVKHKYITFSIEADNPAAARARLSRIETDILNNFKVLGVSAHPLSGYERLKVLHGVFHPAGEPFSFSYDWLTPTGLTTKDFIAPSSFKFGEGRYFAMGKKTGAVSFLEILAPELNDRILADMLDLETGVIVNLHIKSIDQSEAIKTIKRKGAGKCPHSRRLGNGRNNQNTERDFLCNRHEPRANGSCRIWIAPPVRRRKISDYGERYKGFCCSRSAGKLSESCRADHRAKLQHD